MNNKDQFTPLKKAVHVIPMLYAEAFAGSNNKEFVMELYEDARLLETAAPAMYTTGKLSVDVMARVARELERLGNESLRALLRSAIIEQKAALAQAEGRDK